jgi:glutathionylspermidine synthase
MRRVTMTARPDWREKCDEVGFTFHSLPSENDQPYWRETAAYEVSLPEVVQLESETRELFDRCMDAIDFVIQHKRYKEFGIPEAFWPIIEQSWDCDDATVYGRFDLAWQPGSPAKLLEFNADTPTSLVESSVVQWFWLKDMFGDSKDQFNSLHEQLIGQWEHIRQSRWTLPKDSRLHLTSLRDNGDNQLLTEDYDNTAYMAETAQLAGFKPKHTFIEDIKWDEAKQCFVDQDREPMKHIFKLYPWEWLVSEAYAEHLVTAWPHTQWVEPIWKMLLSNKQLLVILWEMFPSHPNLLPAFNTEVPLDGKRYVRKPKLGREGANVQIIESGKVIERAEGGYGSEGYVWQEYCALPELDGWHPVIGSWVVGETPAGIDFRETSTLITGDMAFFVPHYIA